MKIRFIYKGKQHELETDSLLDKLHRAPPAYVVKTGRTPTHLVLGDTEWAQWHGYVAAMEAMNMTRPTGETRASEFCGLPLLRSAEDSLVMAVELETRKLTGGAAVAAARCQEFQHRSQHE